MTRHPKHMLPVRLNQRQQFVNSFLLRNIAQDRLLSAVERHMAASFAYVSVISVGHFARAVHDAAHHGNLDTGGKV